MTEEGRFLARVEGPVSGNVLLAAHAISLGRRPGHAATPSSNRSSPAKSSTSARSSTRALRDHGDNMPAPSSTALTAAADRLADIVRRLEKPLDDGQLRGAEGEAGTVYFSVFDHLVRGEKPLFAFTDASRRPPLDATNALLSFVYALADDGCPRARSNPSASIRPSATCTPTAPAGQASRSI